MPARDILILRGEEVSSLLKGRELDLIDLVGRAYVTHGRGNSSLPHSSFLLFPHRKRDRIIALPAYLGDQFEVSGIKWIASFPDNVNQGIERASAVLILNSMNTGRPEVIMESSLISAQRTAASAALAARTLHGEVGPTRVGFIGCGPINYQIAKFLLAVWPGTRSFKLFDLSRERADEFGNDCVRLQSELTIEIADSSQAVLSACPVVSMATTAATPHISDLSMCLPNATILHVSLRDISPEAILESTNVVDDADHVCRAGTSVYLAEQLVGHRDFINATLAEVLTGDKKLERDQRPVIFSPFGLGVLDVAVAKLVNTLAVEAKIGTVLDSLICVICVICGQTLEEDLPMPKMGKYCKVYPIAKLREFDKWTEKSENVRTEKEVEDGKEVEIQRELTEADYLYLQEDYTVTDGIFIDENTIFADVTPEWISFCKNNLNFEIPVYETAARPVIEQ